MNSEKYCDPDFLEALSELHGEFPGVGYDDSLENYQRKKKIKKVAIKKIIFHGFFYSVFVIGIYLLFRKYNISVFSSMVYGLAWFLVCFLLHND